MAKDKRNSVVLLQARWPSYSDFASDIGVREGTAQVMRTRGVIHPDHFPAIIKSAEKRGIPGVTWETLYALRGVSV